MFDSLWPHGLQPTRFLSPWDSPGKNTGVSCHVLLQCVKVKSLSRVRLLAAPWTAAYQAPPSMGFSRQEYWSGTPVPSPIDTLLLTKTHSLHWGYVFVLHRSVDFSKCVLLCVNNYSISLNSFSALKTPWSMYLSPSCQLLATTDIFTVSIAGLFQNLI